MALCSALNEPMISVRTQLEDEENAAFSKGGVGIINPDVYIVVRSNNNELILGNNRKHWIGLPSDRKQIVIVIGDQVMNPDALPDDFKLSKAIIILFERDKIRFLDLAGAQAGFYRRLPVQN